VSTTQLLQQADVVPQSTAVAVIVSERAAVVEAFSRALHVALAFTLT